jgi:hypothetical protein
MTDILTQKTLVRSDSGTLSLLYLTGQIGGRHELILVRREDGKITEAHTYSQDTALAITEEMSCATPIQCFNDTDHDCPTQKVRSQWVASSGGDLAIELISERTTIQRRSGNWTVLFQGLNHHEDAVGSSTATTTTTAIVPARACAIV